MVFLVMWVSMRVCRMCLSWWLSASWPHWVLCLFSSAGGCHMPYTLCKWFRVWYRWGFVCTCGAPICCLGVCCRDYGPILLILCTLLHLSLVLMGVLYALGCCRRSSWATSSSCEFGCASVTFTILAVVAFSPNHPFSSLPWRLIGAGAPCSSNCICATGVSTGVMVILW